MPRALAFSVLNKESESTVLCCAVLCYVMPRCAVQCSPAQPTVLANFARTSVSVYSKRYSTRRIGQGK
jgi:hypothetical protein